MVNVSSVPQGVVLSLLVVLLAGCFADLPVERDQSINVADEPVVIDFRCPSQDSFPRTPEVCVDRLEAMDRSYGFPLGAAHPTDDQILVLAAVASPDLPSGPSEPVHAQAISGTLFVTRDGGETWTPRDYPLPTLVSPGGGPVFLDLVTSLYVLDSERLVVGALMGSLDRTGVNAQRRDFFMVTSDDLGATWNEPILLSEPGSRVHSASLAAEDELVVAWWTTREFGGDMSAHMKWRQGDGEWQRVGLAARGSSFGRPMIHDGMIHVVVPLPLDRGDLLQIDPQTGQVQHMVTLPRQGLTIAKDGTFLLTSIEISFESERIQVMVSMSETSGREWSEPVDVFANSTFVQGFDCCMYHPWGSALDPHGRYHLLVTAASPRPLTGVPLVAEGNEEVKIHMVYDLDQRVLLRETRLTPTDQEGPSAPPRTLWPDWEAPNSGGSAAVVPLGEQVLLAWGYDKGIDLTFATTEASES